MYGVYTNYIKVIWNFTELSWSCMELACYILYLTSCRLILGHLPYLEINEDCRSELWGKEMHLSHLIYRLWVKTSDCRLWRLLAHTYSFLSTPQVSFNFDFVFILKSFWKNLLGRLNIVSQCRAKITAHCIKNWNVVFTLQVYFESLSKFCLAQHILFQNSEVKNLLAQFLLRIRLVVGIRSHRFLPLFSYHFLPLSSCCRHRCKPRFYSISLRTQSPRDKNPIQRQERMIFP